MKEHDLFRKLAHNSIAVDEGKKYFEGLRKEAKPSFKEVAQFAGQHPHLTSAAAVGLANGAVDALEVPVGYKWMAFKRGLKRGALAGGIASLIAHELPKHASPDGPHNMLRDVAGNVYDKAKDYVTKNKAGLIGGAIGATGVGLLAHRSFKKKDNGRSSEQEITEAAQKQLARDEMDMQEKGIEPSAGFRLKKTFARTSHEIANTLSDHPRTAAAAALPIGFTAGSFIANQLAKSKKK